MKHQRRIGRVFLSVLTGLFCFLLLTLLLYATQIFASFQLQRNDAITELTQIRSRLAASSYQDNDEQLMEELLRAYVQKMALLLADGEISNETLSVLVQCEDSLSAMMVFHEDGTPLYASGDAISDPDFLCLLRESRVEKAENGLSFLAMHLRDDLYLAVGSDFSLFGDDSQKTQYDMSIVAEIAAGMTGNVAVTNRMNGRVLYGPSTMLGRKLDDFLVFPADTALGTSLLVVGPSMLLAATLEHGDYLLLSLFDAFDILQRLNTAVVPALLGFGFLIFLLLAYTEFIRMDMCRGRLGKIHYKQFGKKRYLNTLLLRKLVGFAMVGIVCMVCVVYCLQLLIRSDEQRQNAEHRLDIAVRILEQNQTDRMEFEKQDMAFLTNLAQEAKAMFTFNPSLLNPDGLNAIARLLDVNGICVLDDAGKTIAATSNLQDYELSSNSADDFYPFWDVVNGFAESHVQIVLNDPNSQEQDMVYAGISGENGRGMIMLSLRHDSFKDWQQFYDAETALETVGVDSQSTLLALRSGSTICAFDFSNQYTGLPLDEYGIDEAFLRNGYSGTHQFDGEDCLITTRSLQDWHLLYITPTSQISASSWLFTALAITIGLLAVALTVMPGLLVRSPGEDIRTHANKASSVRKRSEVDAVFGRNGEIELVEHQIEQHTLRNRWSEKRASAKLGYLIKILMAGIGSGLLIFLLFGRHTGNHPLMDRILNQNWDQSLNVYAVSYVAIGVTGIWIIAEMLQNLTQFVTGTFSRRWKTSGILLSNVIRYAALVFSLFFTLKNFGVQTSALATSASLLTLVVGLGCQNLVADLVAGVFLLFEGAFRVGDIVTIDNWHGEVVEIGLRSTKVKNEIGNVKVFQNSRISGAVNMTRELTFAVCDIPLPPGEMLEAYENKLTTSFFPEATKQMEGLRHPLVYEGVVGMSGDNATLRISVKCLEHEREQIKRELYRTLKLWREQSAKEPPAKA